MGEPGGKGVNTPDDGTTPPNQDLDDDDLFVLHDRLEVRVKSLETSLAKKDNEIKALVAENKNMHERLSKLEKKSTEHSNTQKLAEIERTKCSVIVKGLPYHRDTEDFF
jgi:RNA recognition motif-containing protein